MLIYSISACPEKYLPVESKEFIRGTYFGYSSMGMTKIYCNERNRLVVQLEDDRSLINLWWIDGEMQEPAEYNWNDNVKLLRGNDSLSRK